MYFSSGETFIPKGQNQSPSFHFLITKGYWSLSSSTNIVLVAWFEMSSTLQNLTFKGNLTSFCSFSIKNSVVFSLSCLAKTNTKAGITAESAYEKPSPIIVFIARDHHYSNSYFADIKEGDKINVRVIGQRFELNDKSISIIGELMKQHKSKLVIEK